MLKNKLKKITAIIVALAMVLALTACGGGSDTPPASSEGADSTVTSNEPGRTEPDTDPVTNGPGVTMLRQAMIDTDYMAAVAYMGTYFDYYNLADFSEIEEYIAGTFIEEDHPFVADIDAEHFVPHIGGQVYCIVPADENATITIYDYVFDYESYEGGYGDMLYYSEDGQPVLVMGNESEYIPNIIVEIIDSNGNILEYIPCLSGEDGSLETPYEMPYVMDFTSYEKLGYVTENDYTFDPAVLYYAEDWTAYVPTLNDDEVAVSFWFDEYGNMEMCYEVYGGNGYEVYYEGYWYPAEDDSYPASALVFELSLVDDYSDIQIARPDIYTVMSFEYDEYSECVYMTYEDYDFLLDNEADYFYTLYNAVG